MSANDLKASMRMDSTPWETAVARADAKTSAFADKVEHKLSKKLSKMFGAGLVVGALIKPLHDLQDALFGGSERAKEIKDEAGKLHMTGEEYQMVAAAAKESGLSVEEWLAKMKESGKPLSEIMAKLEQFRGAVKFTNEEIAALTSDTFKNWAKDIGDAIAKHIVSALETATDMFAMFALLWNDPEKWTHPLEAMDRAAAAVKEDRANQAKNKAADSKIPTEGLTSSLTKKEKSSGVKADFGTNELQKIGAFVGGGDPSQRALDKIVDHSADTAEATKSSAESLKRIADSKAMDYALGDVDPFH